LTCAIPAFATITSTDPNRSRAAATSAVQASLSATSVAVDAAWPPASVISCATPCAVSASMSDTITANPSEASRRAMAAPMPRPAPVTTATLVPAAVTGAPGSSRWSPCGR
jgi:hypothetical protein